MINFAYHLARAEGRFTRETYRAALPLIVTRKIEPPRSIDLDVFSYSGESALPEQVASIRSFLRHAGSPRRFIIVSDGTYTANSVQLLESIDPAISVRNSVSVGNFGNDRFRAYLSSHPTGKQLALIMSLPMNGPALYVDSDVLFFPGATDLATCIKSANAPAYYLQDCQFSGDPRLLKDAPEQREPVNTGTLLILKPVDWSICVQRFEQLQGEPNFFSNQTLTHLAMHASGARPLDPSKYVLQLDDQFIYSDLHANKSLVLRHYVNPVRHKFWTRLARLMK